MASKGKKTKSSKGKQIRKGIFWTFLILFLVLSLSLLAVVLVFNFKYGKDFRQFEKDAKQLVGESNLDTFRQMETSLVYDVNGDLISVLKGEKDVYYLDYDNIPDAAINAMISIEDKKFMFHEGIDVKANIRAMLALLKNKGNITQGASTITQQLARNIFLSNEVTWERKFKEVFIAIELEKKYSKDQIMEFYLNNVYFANGYYGIQAASKGYFSKNVDELSLSQIAFLCAIPNNPTIYDPINNIDNTKERRDRILEQMYEDGCIGLEEYHAARNEEIELVQIKVSKNNYIETFVFYSATRALMEQQGFEFRTKFKNEKDRKNYEKEYMELYNQFQKSLYYEGYRIYTSIDPNKQQLLQKSVDDALKGYKEKNKEGTYSLQGAAVSIDNKTGRVVAIVGGRYQNTNGYTLNRAYQSYRQPGSAIKPLIVYTPSFERGSYPDDMVVDKAIKDGPSNSYGTYYGEMKLRRAIELSTNTVVWKMFKELTPEVGLSYLLDMNFSKIDRNDYYPAASLGGFTNGVSPLELTAAYATLENDGVYRKPTCIVKILDAQGKEIVGVDNSKKKIYDVNAARIMTDVLKGVIKNGTGEGLALDHMTSAGKTGTTNDKKDGWFVGYTPYYTTGVWVGYDKPKAMEELSGASFPGAIWKNYMNQIHKKLKNKEFKAYVDNRVQENPVKDEPEEETIQPDAIDTDTGFEEPDIPDENNFEENQDNTQEEPVDWNDIGESQDIDWEENNNEEDFPGTDQEYQDSIEEFPENNNSDFSQTEENQDAFEEQPENAWPEEDTLNSH
jgi:1A family penicillin-binding protein